MKFKIVVVNSVTLFLAPKAHQDPKIMDFRTHPDQVWTHDYTKFKYMFKGIFTQSKKLCLLRVVLDASELFKMVGNEIKWFKINSKSL